MLRAMEDMIVLVERPGTKTGYGTLFNQSLLIKERSTFRLPGSDTHWRHGWFYDACADQEPQVSGDSHRSVMTQPPQCDDPVAKMFFESALAVGKANDYMIVPMAGQQVQPRL